MIESKEPRNLLDRDVKATPGQLAKLVLGAATLNPHITLNGLAEIIEQNGVSELLWHFAKDALEQSVEIVLKESRSERTENIEIRPFHEDIKNILREHPVKLEPDLFSNPRKIEAFQKVKQAFAVLLEQHGLKPSEAKAMVDRLDSKFINALLGGYVEHIESYGQLETIVNSSLFATAMDEQRWELYRKHLIAEADEAVFGDVFSLQQIYIPLRAYHRYISSSGVLPDRFLHAATSGVREWSANIVVDLYEHVENWLANDDSVVCMVSGGPGSGKSSFTKMLAKWQAEQGRHVLRVPLHELNLDTTSYIQSLGEHLQKKLKLSENPLDQVDETRPLLLILDGLDELTKQGETTSNLVSGLLNSVEHEARGKQRDADKAVLKILVSGRPIVTQGQKGQWKSKHPLELHLLPYHITDEQHRRNSLFAEEEKLLHHDQRKDWWEKFADFKNKNYGEISKRLSNFSEGSVAEITGQPLLNYLVARLYPELDIDPSINLNSLYEALIGDVYERDWDPEGNVRHIPGTFDKKQFLKALETVALAAWHSGDTRTATYEVVERCGKDFKRPIKLEAFRIGAEEGFARLLTAFYFRKTNVQEGKERFEFTHKSFGDYLVARVLVDEFAYISDKLANEDDRDGWRLSEALVYWARLCGPNMMSATILDFLRQEVRLRSDSDQDTVSADDLALWQEHAAKLLSETIYNSMPVHELKLSSFGEMAEQAQNAEESLLAMHSAIAGVTKQKGNILKEEDTDRRTFKKWLMRLQGHVQGTVTSILTTCLNDLALSGLELERVELSRANLARADLRGADLRGAYLRRADLSEAYLSEANLIGADLSGADLSGANLIGADLGRADLSGANLRRADLIGADLIGANLIGADLSGANLIGADLSGADLRGADLREAKTLNEARFTRQGLEEAGFGVEKFRARGAIIED